MDDYDAVTLLKSVPNEIQTDWETSEFAKVCKQNTVTRMSPDSNLHTTLHFDRAYEFLHMSPTNICCTTVFLLENQVHALLTSSQYTIALMYVSEI